jgi:hypothetical protein
MEESHSADQPGMPLPLELHAITEAYLAGTLTADQAADRLFNLRQRLKELLPPDPPVAELEAEFERLRSAYEAGFVPNLVLIDDSEDPARRKAFDLLNEALNRRYSGGVG